MLLAAHALLQMALQIEDLHLALKLVADAGALLHSLGEEEDAVNQLDAGQVTLDDIVPDLIWNVLDGHGEFDTACVLHGDGCVAESVEHLLPEEAHDHALAP